MATQLTLNDGSLNSAGSLLLKTNGTTTAVTIDTAQNLGLGVTPSAWNSPYKALDISSGGAVTGLTGAVVLWGNSYEASGGASKYKTSTYAAAYSCGNGHTWYTAPSGTAGATCTFTAAMTLDASGNLGVGMTTPSSSGVDTGVQRIVAQAPNSNTGAAILAVADSVGRTISISDQTKTYVGFLNINSSGVSVGSTSNIPLLLYSNNAERARIDSSGNLLVGTTSTVLGAQITNTFAATSKNGMTLNETSGTTGATFVYFSASGTAIGNISRVSTTNAVAYNTTSDQRLKSNIEDAAPVLDKLMQVQVRQYDWSGTDFHQDYGFIAQELEPVLSGVVTKGKTEDDMWQLDYSKLTPHLVKAIQEQQAIIDAQQAALNTLTARIEALEQA